MSNLCNVRVIIECPQTRVSDLLSTVLLKAVPLQGEI